MIPAARTGFETRARPEILAVTGKLRLTQTRQRERHYGCQVGNARPHATPHKGRKTTFVQERLTHKVTYDSPLKDPLSAETRTSVCDPLHILVWRDHAACLTVPGRAICLVAPDRHRYPRQ
jgi:hypothetical protein